MDNQIRLDTRDWGSIEDTIQKINRIGSMQFAHNSEGEPIVLDVFRDDEGHDGLHITIHQDNGWDRHNYYYPSDLYVEERYERSK